MPSRRATTFILAILCVVSLGLCGFAQQGTQPARSGHIVELTIPAPSLKGNLLGDPTEQSIAIYLPPGYETSSTKRYPTLYLLHGFIGTNRTWTKDGNQGMNLQPLVDELIRLGKTRELIVVMPNGWNAYKGAFYSNSSVNGNWEDYIYRDVVQYVDTNYRTLSKVESRGIAGHSMGGYGAMTLAMRHPDVFGAVYSLSPCCFGIEGDLTSENPAWLQTIRLKSKDQLKDRPSSFDEFFELAFIASAAAFSPNPNRPPFFVELPFIESNGRLEPNEAVLAKWKAKMPLYMIDEYKDNLLKLKGIFVDYGEKEEFSHIRIATSKFSRALAERNIPHVFEVYPDGTHGSLIRQRLQTRLFQFFNEKLDFGSSN